MSYVKLQNENFDTFSLTLRPRYEFSSSSSGITGSVPLIERPSAINKDLSKKGTAFNYNEGDSEQDQRLRDIAALSSNSSLSANTSRANLLIGYLNDVRDKREYIKNDIVIPIQRLTQSVDYTTSSMMKRVITNNLMTAYRSGYTDCNFSYKNYHSINFFTSSTVPSDSAIIYPNRIGGSGISSNFEKRFNLTYEFSVDFFINPRYLADRGAPYHAGTILHISSSICVSLHTGSSKNQNDQVDGFRLAVGFEKSADVRPNLIDTSITNGTRTGKQEYVYVSSDNILKYNNWHHVTIRWGKTSTSKIGSFIVDGVKSNFINLSSIISPGGETDDVLILGNFCELPVTQPSKRFFNYSVAADEGLIAINNAGSSDPVGFTFTNPLNAEIHDFKLFDRAISDKEIENFSRSGANNNTKNLVFYVPGLFTNQYTKEQSDFVTPILKQSLTPVTPFNVNLAHATQVFSPNLQNFLFDLTNFKKMGSSALTKNKQYEAFPVAPRLYKLTASANTTIVDQFAIDHMLRDPAFAKRMYTLLPCDNGFFTPDYSILGDSSTSTYFPYKDDIGNSDKTSISLQNTDINTPVQTSLGTVTVDLYELERGQLGERNRRKRFPRPNRFSEIAPLLADGILSQGNITTLLTFSGSINARTAGFTNTRIADNSSNLVSMYIYSNLYYGNQIFPSSLQISSTILTGSGGKINITLKDNGAGGLYRDDALTPAATWATVGNIFYDQGIAIIKSPNLYYFGKDNFSTEFNGSQNIHTYTLDAICPAGEINSSSNPSYLSFPPTNEQNETADNFVYITGINIHDDNFNVIMRANLAQPVLKRPDDEILFRLKQDF